MMHGVNESGRGHANPAFCAVAIAAVASAPVTLSAQEPVAKTEIDLGTGVKMSLVLIKAGKFTQGSPATEPLRGDDEPQRTVVISKDFYIGQYPVTVSQFKRFVAESKYKTKAEEGDSGGFGIVTARSSQARQKVQWRNPGFKQEDDIPCAGHPRGCHRIHEMALEEDWQDL